MSADDEIIIGGDSVDIPDGTYPATVDTITVRHSDKYDNDFRAWTFELDGGGVVPGATSMATGQKSKGGRWIRNLLGRKPDAGEKVKLSGRPCLVVVETDEGGWPRVADVLPPMQSPSGTAAASPRAAAAADPETVPDDLPF